MLAYDNVESLGPGRVAYEQPDVAFRCRADFLLFAPDEGDLLEAEVTEIKKGHIALLHKGVFQVTVREPRGFEFDEATRTYSMVRRDGGARAQITTQSVQRVRVVKFVPSQTSFFLLAKLAVPGMEEDENDDGEPPELVGVNESPTPRGGGARAGSGAGAGAPRTSSTAARKSSLKPSSSGSNNNNNNNAGANGKRPAGGSGVGANGHGGAAGGEAADEAPAGPAKKRVRIDMVPSVRTHS